MKLVTESELLRLKTIARLYARGLPPDVSWEDLLQEAITRVLVGARRQPKDLPVVAFLAGIMRSLSSEHWRRATGRRGRTGSVAQSVEASKELDLRDPAPGPERATIARQQLLAIEQLFADDPVVMKIIAGMAEKQSAGQFRRAIGISNTEYESARRRMRRALIREGLTCEPR
jgi:RNA polymerase sigma-70 factor (ECF subfamily)